MGGIPNTGGHPSADELYELAEGRPDSVWQVHIDNCVACRRQLDALSEAATALHSLKPVSDFTDRGCPSSAEIRDPGLEPGRLAYIYEHAEHCEACARILSEDPDAGVEEAVAALPSSTAAGRAAIVADLAPRRAKPRVPWQWGLAAAAAVAAIIFSMQWYRSRPGPGEAALEMLSAASTEMRTMELRFPGAGYAAVQVAMGSGGQQAASLIRAKARIQDEAAAAPEDGTVLQAAGRASLLEWDPAGAMQNLRRALEKRPGDAAILADLAMAYYERAEQSGERGAADYAEMAELLNRSLAARPRDPPALFNLAIAYEKLHMNTKAMEAWERYLALPAEAGWAAEATARLEALKKKPVRDP